MRTVLALDASLCNTGYTVYEFQEDWVLMEFGIVKTESKSGKKGKLYKGDDMSRRIRKIVEELADVIDRMRPNIICCEMTSGGSKSKSAAAGLATAKAIVVTMCLERGIPLLEVPQDDVKVALHGSKTASKANMKEAACRLYPDLRKPNLSKTASDGFRGDFEHVADSVGVFKACRQMPTMQMLEQM